MVPLRLAGLVLVFMLIGCRQPAGDATPTTMVVTPDGQATETSMSETPFELLTYVASGGQPAVYAALELTGTGEATLVTETSWSIPPELRDRAGTFSGPVPADLWTALLAQIEAAGLFEQQRRDQATSPDSTVRYLTVKKGTAETRLSLLGSGDDPALEEVEASLVAIMTALLAQPRHAIGLQVELVENTTTVTPTVTLTHLGTEPQLLLLLDPDTAGMWPRITPVVEKGILLGPDELMWLPVSSDTVSLAAITALADAGAFVSGIHEMAPGAVYSLPLPALVLPAGEAYVALRVRVTFWFPGTGPARRLVTLELPRIILRDGIVPDAS